MRKSRVLLAGVAIAAAGAATSAFTAGNTSEDLDNNVAGYGQLDVSGVNVSNIAYTPASDASLLDKVVFTVDMDVTSMSSRMTLSSGSTALNSPSTCTPATSGAIYTISCDLTTDVAFEAFDKTALTVTSN